MTTKEPMTSPGYRADVVAVLGQMLGAIPGVAQAKSFGLPGFHVGRKFFAMAYGEGVALKLPRETIATLLDRPGFAPFQPFGKSVMKEWVMLTHSDPQAYLGDLALFEDALAFVAGQPPKKP